MTITQDSSAPLVVVTGATGNQGGSVINALADSTKSYRIRGLTRDITKQSAQALSQRGVATVGVTLSVDHKNDVVKAFQGADYIFILTNFWEHFDKQREITEGKMMMDAAASVNPKLVIWSGLQDFTAVSNGKYTHVDHFDGKAAVTAYGRSLGVPLANVEAGTYMENYLTMSAPKKIGDGKFAIFAPVPGESKICLLDTKHDYGLFVREAIESSRGQQSDPSSEIFAHGDEISWNEIAKTVGEMTGKDVVFMQASEEQFMKGAMGAGMPEAVAKELLEMYQAIAEFGYYGPKDTALSRKYLAKPARTWADFVRANKAKFEELMA